MNRAKICPPHKETNSETINERNHAMPGKSINPSQTAEALVLREAGYSVTAIAERTGVGIRSLQRLFQRHGVRKGSIKAEMVEQARKQLMDAVTSEAIKVEAARIVQDDLAQVRALRTRLALAAEQLTATNLVEAAVVMRAGAAWATALKCSTDMLRHTLRFDKKLEAEEEAVLPDLIVTVIDAADARAMQDNDDLQ
jgi:hypothetical protein